MIVVVSCDLFKVPFKNVIVKKPGLFGNHFYSCANPIACLYDTNNPITPENHILIRFFNLINLFIFLSC